jgi:GT2 family glycosyltransferase
VLEIIVVDNASSDGTVQMLRREFPAINVIANEENIGFAAACNQGLIIARGRYWMLLNPDTEVEKDVPNPFATLIDFMDTNPRAGVCGPSLFYGDGKRQDSAFGFPSLAQVYMDLYPVNWRLRASRWNGRYPRAWYERGLPFPIDHPLGAALLVRPMAARQVGYLDESYFIYSEEIDWCLRIKRAGWQIWCVPQARLIHHEARSTRQFRDKMFVELWRSRLRYFRKNHSRAFNVALRQLVRRGMRRARKAARYDETLSLTEREQRIATYDRVTELAQEEG